MVLFMYLFWGGAVIFSLSKDVCKMIKERNLLRLGYEFEVYGLGVDQNGASLSSKLTAGDPQKRTLSLSKGIIKVLPNLSSLQSRASTSSANSLFEAPFF